MTATHEIVIRKMSENDLQPAMDILASWNMAPCAPTAEIPDPERCTIIVAHTFVALSGETVVGLASYILHGNGWAETASFAVAPEWLGRGVGARLQDARLVELRGLGIERVRTESDRENVIDWYVRKYGYRIVGTAPKKHAFGLESVNHWTVLELDLRAARPAEQPRTSP